MKKLMQTTKDNNSIIRLRALLLSLFMMITVSFISNLSLAQTTEDYTIISAGVKYQYVSTYSVARLDSILTIDASEFCEFQVTFPPAKYAVKLYRVIYNSVIPEFYNKPTSASGLIAIPVSGTDSMPVVSYQHGTIFSKDDAPSNPERSGETRLMIAQFASQGYIIVFPDYFGEGQSAEPDSYQVKESSNQACYDMLSASKEVCKALNVKQGTLFLFGWSAGSWATLHFLKRLESLNITVQAVSIACAPTDIYALTNRWFHAPSPTDAAWLPGVLAYQLNAYEEYYKLPGLMHSAIKPEYQKATLDFYQNKITFTEFTNNTATTLIKLLKPEFIAASSTGDTRFFQILQDNNSYRFRSKTPVNIYYGESDEVIPIYIGTLPSAYQELIGGAKTTSISAGKLADHRGTFKFSLLEGKKWFDTLLK